MQLLVGLVQRSSNSINFCGAACPECRNSISISDSTSNMETGLDINGSMADFELN